MPRTPGVRYYESKKGYFCQVNRRRRRLSSGPRDEPDGPTYRAAVRRFAELLGKSPSRDDGDEDEAPDATVREVILRFERHLEAEGRDRSLGILRTSCHSALERFGETPTGELRTIQVLDWLMAMGEDRGISGRGRRKLWGATMKALSADKLLAALNWGAEQGLCRPHRVKRKALGLRNRSCRGREYVLPEGEHTALLTLARPCFAELLSFLEATGCRPGEAYHAEAHNYDAADGVLVFRHDAVRGYVHKTARRTGRDRVIYLAPAMRELVERLCREHPNGPLFRNRVGRAWTNSAVYMGLKRLRKRLNSPGKMIPYSYRHTFATRWLLSGRSIKVLADLLGNSVAIIEKHYGHLEVDRARMRRMLEEFSLAK